MRGQYLAAALAMIGLLGMAVAAGVLLAQHPGSDRTASSYRRIFVPQDELQSQVKGLLPMKREEFDRRLAAASTTAPDASAGLRITRAVYQARLEGEDLVAGQARLEISASAGTAGLLALEPCNLALGIGTWEETPPRRAVLGIGPRNVLSLHADKSGTVVLPWSRRGQTTDEGALEFDLELPPASLQHMRLRLPAHLQLTAAQGLVLRADPPVAEDGMSEWIVELGGMARARLRVDDKAKASAAGNLALIKEQVRYSLTLTDLAADYEFQLDLHGRALTIAHLQPDPRLRVTGVTVRGQPVEWSLAGDEKGRTLSIEFPEPLAGGNHSISVQAVAELVAGQPWKLPRIRWQDAIWQEGSAVLTIPPSMQMAVISTSGCRVSKGVPPPALGESLGFLYHAADGYVEITALPRQPRLTASLGVTVQFDPATQVSATLRADLTSQEGEIFEVDALVSHDWTLDSLETEPADLLEDRPVVTQDDRSRTMRLKFSRPITPQSPVRLVVRARRQQPSSGDFSSDSLWRWFRLPGAIEQPTVLALRNNIANYDLQVAGDGDAIRIDPEASASEESGLLDSPPSGLLFRLRADASDFRVVLREGEPRYTAVWDVTAACGRNRLRQEVTVRCTPSGPGLSRLTLRSSPPPNREIRWRVTGASDATVVAQTRRDTSVSTENSLAEAIWELELSRPLTQPFALETAWESPRAPRQSVALFSSLEATAQTCHVRVAAEDDSRWSLSVRGLNALPVPAQGTGRFTRTRGLFRYEPGPGASLTVADANDSTLAPLARVTQAVLTTRFAADGSALDVLSLDVENEGLTELPLHLPSLTTLQEVAVGRRAVEPLLSGSRSGNMRIPLPEGVRHVNVKVSYATPAQQRPLYAGVWRTHLPELSVPPPPVSWRVALPPGIRAVDDGRSHTWQAQWQARLWGPFVEGLPWMRWLHPWRKTAPLAMGTSDGLGSDDDSDRSGEPASNRGWMLVSQQSPWSDALMLEVYQPHRSTLFSLSLALLAAGLVLTAPRRWLASWFLTGTVLASAVLLTPVVAAPLLAGAFWGIVAGCAAALLRPAAARTSNHEASRASTTRWWAAASASAILLLSGLIWTCASALHAQPPPANRQENTAKRNLRVVIPVDDEQMPTGDYVFVDEGLYDWLHEQPEHGQRAEPWQLEDAVYVVRWPEGQAADTPAAEIRVNLEISTFAPDTSVTLPFRRGDLLLQQGGARLDGHPLAMSWQEDGRGLTALIPAPGKYRLELATSAPLQEAGKHRELRLAIPRAPHAVVHVSGAAGAAPFTAPSALGSLGPSTESVDSSYQIELGASEELSLRSTAADSVGQEQAVEAEQLLSWKVRPGSVVVDAVCKFRPLTGSIREVQLRFDPRLRLLPLEGLPEAAKHWVEMGSVNTLHVALAEPADSVVIRPRFLLAESSGIGKIIPPPVAAVAGRISRKWMAVTTGPGVELVSTQQAAAIPPADFAQAFGAIDDIPAAAFDLAGASIPPELEFRPEARVVSATAETTVYCSLHQCRLSFQAELTGLAPHHVQQRVQIPPGWTATQVAMRDGDLPAACRWFQQADGVIVVRLEQPPGNSRQLQIEATFTPLAGSSPILPAVQLLEVSDAGQSLRIVRSQDCAVQIQEAIGWMDDDRETRDQPVDGRGRLVTSLRSAAGNNRRQLTMQIAPNRPQVAARLVTRYARPSPHGAVAIVVCDLQISGGKLDELRLDAPPEWSGPWESSPPMTVRHVAIPGQSHRHVTLLPALPLEGKVRLTIQSPLRPTAGEPLHVPEITLVDLPQADRFVQLPKARSGESSKWSISSLQAAALPPDLQGGILSDGEYETLAVVGSHFDAVLSANARSPLSPLVSLVEYRARWQTPGVVHGEATFCCDLAGLESCLIQLDDGYRPTSASLDGIAAELVHEQGSCWTLRLPGDRLPQRLVIGFIGSPQPARGLLRITGPTLVGLPAQATIWSLTSSDSLTAGSSPLRDEGELVHLDQDLLILAAAAEMLGRARQRDVTGFSGDALVTWLTPWRSDVAAAAHRAQAALRTLVADDGQRLAKFRQIEADLDRHWQALPGIQTPTEVARNAAVAADAGQQRVLGGAFSGHESQVVLALVDPAALEPRRRMGMALAVLLLGTSAWLLSRWSVVRDWVAASSPFAVVVIGIALTFLSPLGLAALALPGMALITVWRSSWSQRIGERRSSIIRIQRPSRRTT